MNWIKDLVNKIRHSYYGIAKVLAFVVAIVLVCLLMPRTGKFKYEFQLSKPWQHETLYAPFDFPIYKSPELVQHERDSLFNEFEPYYNYNKDVEARQIAQLRKDYADGTIHADT